MEYLPQHNNLCAMQAASVNNAFKNAIQHAAGGGIRQLFNTMAVKEDLLDLSNCRKYPGFRLFWVLTPVAVRK